MAVKSLIQTVTVGSGGAASIEFTGIPQDGVSLVLKLSLRSANTDIAGAALVSINNSAGQVYQNLYLNGEGSGTPDSSSRNDTGYFFLWTNQATSTSNTFSSAELYFSNYTSTSSVPISIDNVTENNATSARQMLHAVNYSGGSAVASIKLQPQSSQNWLQYSTASLYKIKYD